MVFGSTLSQGAGGPSVWDWYPPALTFHRYKEGVWEQPSFGTVSLGSAVFFAKEISGSQALLAKAKGSHQFDLNIEPALVAP